MIRAANERDMATCMALYNNLIDSTTVAWTEDHQTLEERMAWFATQQDNDLPVLVAEQGDQVLGFAAYGSFRGSGKWPGYRHTVEHTIYVDDDHQGKGIGRALLEALIDHAQTNDIHVMVGAVDGDNADSIKFHERLGFEEVARMPQVGRKFDRWLELVLLQRILD